MDRLMKYLKIYTTNLQKISISYVYLQYKNINDVGIRSLKLSTIEYNENKTKCIIQITNQDYIDTVITNSLDWVKISIVSPEQTPITLTIIEEYSLLSVIDVKINEGQSINIPRYVGHIDDVDEYTLKDKYNVDIRYEDYIELLYYNKLGLNIISTETDLEVLAKVVYIYYYDINDVLIEKVNIQVELLDSQYNLIIDSVLNRIPHYFTLELNSETDALLSFNQTDYNNIKTKDSKIKHINSRHYFNRDIVDNIYLNFKFNNICKGENVNSLLIGKLLNVTINKGEDTEQITEVLFENNCIYTQVKDIPVNSIELNIDSIEELENVLIDVYSTYYIGSTFTTKLELFNPLPINNITLLENLPPEVKINTIRTLCGDNATLLLLTLDNVSSELMTIYDIDVNHLFKTYQFNYHSSFDKEGLTSFVFICPDTFILDDVNFVGLKYYFGDISRSYKLKIELFNDEMYKSIDNVKLSGRTTTSVIPLDHKLDEDIPSYIENVSSDVFYNNVGDLPSEYVIYGGLDYIGNRSLLLRYKDIDLSLTRTFDGDFNILSDTKVIMQSLFNLFLSIKNDRPLKPWLEANLRNRLFDIEGNLLSYILKTYIQKYLGQVEPRVEIKDLDVGYIDNNFNSLQVVIVFTILESNEEIPFSFNIQAES